MLGKERDALEPAMVGTATGSPSLVERGSLPACCHCRPRFDSSPDARSNTRCFQTPSSMWCDPPDPPTIHPMIHMCICLVLVHYIQFGWASEESHQVTRRAWHLQSLVEMRRQEHSPALAPGHFESSGHMPLLACLLVNTKVTVSLPPWWSRSIAWRSPFARGHPV